MIVASLWAFEIQLVVQVINVLDTMKGDKVTCPDCQGEDALSGAQQKFQHLTLYI